MSLFGTRSNHQKTGTFKKDRTSQENRNDTKRHTHTHKHVIDPCALKPQPTKTPHSSLRRSQKWYDDKKHCGSVFLRAPAVLLRRLHIRVSRSKVMFFWFAFGWFLGRPAIGHPQVFSRPPGVDQSSLFAHWPDPAIQGSSGHKFVLFRSRQWFACSRSLNCLFGWFVSACP